MNLSIKAVEKFIKAGLVVCAVSVVAILISALVEVSGLGIVGNAPIYALSVGVVMVVLGYIIGSVKMIFKI